MIRWSLWTLLLLAVPARSGVVELVPAVSNTFAVPQLSAVPSFASVPNLAVSGAVLTPSLSASLPSPSLAVHSTPSLPPSPLTPSFVPAALSVKPLSPAVIGHDTRGPPPSAKDQGFGAFVAHSVADQVRSWTVPVESIFADHDALLVGENHGSLSSVETLAREMPRLKKAGVVAVGIEGLKRRQQDAVDAFTSGASKSLPDEVLSFSPRRRASFMALLEAARDSGVRVVALGLPLDGWAKEAAALAAANTGEPESFFPSTVDGHFERAGAEYEAGYNEAVAEVFLTRRNKAMASFLKDALKTGGKAVVLVGQAHVDGLDMVPGRLMNAPGDWGTLARELGSLALKAYSLTMTGGLFVSTHDALVDRHARPESYAKAAANGSGAPSFTPLSGDAALWHAGGTVKPVAVH